MISGKPWVVVRTRDSMPGVRDTMRCLRDQEGGCRILVMENDSKDGTAELVREVADRVLLVPAGSYVPGRVLNRAMRETDGELVLFLNSDSQPQDRLWLRHLLDGAADSTIAAAFGRQIPQADSGLLQAKDTEDTFGDGGRQRYWKHCFSMASSIIRRSVWEEMPFREDIQYSEDIDWTWRARQKKYQIRYVARAVVAHSNHFDLLGVYRRQYGEGRAEARIFEWRPWERSLLRYSVLPYLRQVLSDWRYCIHRRAPWAMVQSPLMRFVQLLGRRAGFLHGWRER